MRARATGKERAQGFSEHQELVIAVIQDLADRDPDREVLETLDFERISTNKALAQVVFPPESENFQLESVTFAANY